MLVKRTLLPIGSFLLLSVAPLLQCRYCGYRCAMPRHITETDRQRIEKFLRTPKYARGPHLLEPDQDDGEA